MSKSSDEADEDDGKERNCGRRCASASRFDIEDSNEAIESAEGSEIDSALC